MPKLSYCERLVNRFKDCLSQTSSRVQYTLDVTPALLAKQAAETTASQPVQNAKRERPVVSTPQQRSGVHTLHAPAKAVAEPALFVGQGYALSSKDSLESKDKANSRLLKEQSDRQPYQSPNAARRAPVSPARDTNKEGPDVSTRQQQSRVHTLRGAAKPTVESGLFVGQSHTLGSDNELGPQHSAKSKLLMEQPGGERYPSRDTASSTHISVDPALWNRPKGTPHNRDALPVERRGSLSEHTKGLLNLFTGGARSQRR